MSMVGSKITSSSENKDLKMAIIVVPGNTNRKGKRLSTIDLLIKAL
jgi:hypothetical protein